MKPKDVKEGHMDSQALPFMTPLHPLQLLKVCD